MKIVKTVACVILALIIFAGVFGGTAMIAANGVVSDPPALAEKIADAEYDAAVCAAVRDEIDRAMMLLSVSENIFDGNVTDADINEASHTMLAAVTARILRRDDSPLPEFSNEKLRAAIRADIEKYAEEHDLEADADAPDEVYSYICGRVTDQIRVASEKYIDKVPDLTKLEKLISMWYIPFAAAFVCAAAIFVIRRRELVRALTAVTIPVYAASFIGLVVFRVLEAKDYISKVSLDRSILREFLIRVYRIAVGSFARAFGIALIAALVLLAVNVVTAALFGLGGKEKREKKDVGGYPADGPSPDEKSAEDRPSADI